MEPDYVFIREWVGIVRENAGAPYTPEQRNIAARYHRILAGRGMLPQDYAALFIAQREFFPEVAAL